MKHRITYYVETKKKGLFGIPRKVKEKKVVYVDSKAYKKLKRERNNRSFFIEEMILYDLVNEE